MPDAVYHNVVKAVGQRVLTVITNDVTREEVVYRRRKPAVLESDGIPCVVVCPAADGERVIFETFGGQVVYGYPVTCLLVSKGNTIETPELANPEEAATDADTATATHMSLRELVRNEIYKTTLSGVSSVFNGEIVTGQPVTIIGGGGSLYIVSAMTVTYWSLETQTW